MSKFYATTDEIVSYNLTLAAGLHCFDPRGGTANFIAALEELIEGKELQVSLKPGKKDTKWADQNTVLFEDSNIMVHRLTTDNDGKPKVGEPVGMATVLTSRDGEYGDSKLCIFVIYTVHDGENASSYTQKLDIPEPFYVHEAAMIWEQVFLKFFQYAGII